MAHFQTVPGGERISGRTITVDRPTFAVGLWGPLESASRELDVRTDDARVTAKQGVLRSNIRAWTLSGPDGARARIKAIASDGSTWDTFEIGFQKAHAPGATSVSVWPVTQEIFGNDSADHLLQATIPSIRHIDVSTFRAGDVNNAPTFSAKGSMSGRVGVFACSNGKSTRAVILLAPATGVADAVLVGVTHGFGQNTAFYTAKGWSDPLSKPLIEFAAKKFVGDRWGAQMLAAKKNLALALIVRAQGVELGPFAGNGGFLAHALAAIARLTGGAFRHDQAEFFTYSSGIYDLNPLVATAQSHLKIRAVYSLDPAGAHAASRPPGAALKQFLSGQTGHPRAGFEYMPLNRWVNEPRYARVHPPRGVPPQISLFDYLHNACMPEYTLYLGIQLS